MRRYFSVLALLILFSNEIRSQNTIVLDHLGSSSVHSNLLSAFAAASDGDTLFLSGGSYSLVGFTYDKAVHLIGAGYHPDSTQATLPTVLGGTLRLLNTASQGSIEGVLVTGEVLFGVNTTNDNVTDFVFRRCLIQSSVALNMDSTLPHSSDCGFFECIFFSDVNCAYSTNVIHSKCIFYSSLESVSNGLAESCIFAEDNNNTLYGCTYSIFQNNIFLMSFTTDNNNSFCQFSNNVFVGNMPCQFGSGNICSPNLDNIPEDQIFIDYAVNSTSGSYYQQNFRLAESSVALGAGTNGIDCGIYGGDAPFKDGGVPSNPHIQMKLISSETDPQGNLPVQIKVAAQEN